MVSVEIAVEVSRFQTGSYLRCFGHPDLTQIEILVPYPVRYQKTTWLVQHAGICLGAGLLREALVNKLEMCSENTNTGEQSRLGKGRKAAKI